MTSPKSSSCKHHQSNPSPASGNGPLRTSRRQGREYLFKILVVGELGVGKTSFIKRYVHQFFSAHYRATIGVDFALKIINWKEDDVVRIQLWDIAGQERFGNMTRVYYKEAVGAFLVFDVQRPQTFEAALKWKHDLDLKVAYPDGSPLPVVLLANKSDEERMGSLGDDHFLRDFCAEHGFEGHFYTSPKENVNIEEAARFLVAKIIQKHRFLDGSIEESHDLRGLSLREPYGERNKKRAKERKCC